jgi:hypothetical protein
MDLVMNFSFFWFSQKRGELVHLSLVESLTITPMRCAGFVHHGERTTKIGRGFEAFMESVALLSMMDK